MNAMDLDMLRAVGLDADKVVAFNDALEEADVAVDGLGGGERLFVLMTLVLGLLETTPKGTQGDLRDALYLAIRLGRIAPVVRFVSDAERARRETVKGTPS